MRFTSIELASLASSASRKVRRRLVAAALRPVAEMVPTLAANTHAIATGSLGSPVNTTSSSFGCLLLLLHSAPSQTPLGPRSSVKAQGRNPEVFWLQCRTVLSILLTVAALGFAF